MSEESKPLVLISGASGYLAGHIIKQALEDGYRVRGTVRSLSQPEKYDFLSQQGVELAAANLTSDDGWVEAMQDVQYVLHTASPFTSGGTEEDFVRPAVDGTRRVLEAASKSPTVQRVVVTSSCVAISYGHQPYSKPEGHVFTPNNWSEVDNLDPYSKSKTLAERSAWDFQTENDECKFELVTVNPGFIMGPLLQKKDCESATVVRQMMTGGIPMLPRISLGIVDVRDVAVVHIRALTAADAPGKRLICAPDSKWFADVAELMYSKYGEDGWPISTRAAPDFLLKVGSNFDTQMAQIVADLGNWHGHDSSDTEAVCGFKFRETNQSWFDMVESQIKLGMLEKPASSGCVFL